MFLTVHATFGALIGQYTGNIFFGFVVGFISHFLVDALPHGDEKMIENKDRPSKKELLIITIVASFDIVITLILTSAYLYFGLVDFSWSLIACIIGSVSPDFINGFYMITRLKILQAQSEFHFQIHFVIEKIAVSLWTGVLLQFLTLLLLIGLLYIY